MAGDGGRVWVRRGYLTTMLLVAATAGLEFAHVLEWPQKAHYPAELYSELQESLYVWFGNLGGVLFVLAVLGCLVAAVSARRWTGSARREIRGAAGLAVLGLIVFLTVVYPVNPQFPVDVPSVVVPPDWQALRIRWEVGHALGFVLFSAAFVLLVLAWPAVDAGTRARARGRP